MVEEEKIQAGEEGKKGNLTLIIVMLKRTSLGQCRIPINDISSSKVDISGNPMLRRRVPSLSARPLPPSPLH